jgi:hypothetical protein
MKTDATPALADVALKRGEPALSDAAAHVPDEVITEPTLPSFELPDFEGLKPVGVNTKVNGSGQRIGRAMHLEERVIIVAECEVANIGHGTTDAGVKRIQTLAVRDLYELEGKAGKKLLRGLRAAYRLADDARHGRKNLHDHGMNVADPNVSGVEVTTDGSGVLVTPGERGGLAGLGLPDVETFVLVFEGGRRAVWPDEFEDGAAALGSARPSAGAFVDDEQVRQVLDGDTGETLEEWTDEQENARLLELEQKAAEEEAAAAKANARGDLEAMAELERGRGRCGHIYDGGVCAREAGHPGEHVAAAGGPGDTSNVVEGTFGEPWPDYESCTVSDVEAALEEETDRDKVFAVAAYEERHGARKGVLKACTKRVAELEAEQS